MSESIQHKLTRVRPPRVKITYDVETGDAIEMKQLPFVVGIMADLAGKPAEPLPFLKDRKFAEIDRDNFNDIMASLKPRLAFQVANTLDEESDSQLNVELNFSHLDDFSPASIVQQVEPLRKLFEARQRLNDLVAKLDGNDDLDHLLQEIAESTEQQEQLKQQTAKSEAAGEGGEGDEAAAPAAEGGE